MFDEYEDEVWQDFVFWVNERHKIFERKHLRGEDPPWTEDPILQERHFCNVYRELDRTTRWYINNFVGDTDLSPQDHFLNSLILRTVNKPQTMEVIGKQHVDSFDKDQIVSDVFGAEDDGTLDSTFSSAYMITGAIGTSGEKKIQSYAREVWGYTAENIEQYMWDDMTPEEWTEELTELPGVADFIAYEIYCDLTYHEFFPWDENDYVNPGPGARRCIQRLLGLEVNASKKQGVDYREHIERIREHQDEWLPETFNKWEGNDLTLRGIEHSMCEVDKYRRSKDADTVRLKKHRPTEAALGIENERDWNKEPQDTFSSF